MRTFIQKLEGHVTAKYIVIIPCILSVGYSRVANLGIKGGYRIYSVQIGKWVAFSIKHRVRYW